MKGENAIMYEIITKRKAYIVPVLFAVLFLIVSLVGCASLDAPDQSDGEVAENAVNTDCPLCGDNGENSCSSLCRGKCTICP